MEVKVLMIITHIAVAVGLNFNSSLSMSQQGYIVDEATCHAMEKSQPAPLNVPEGVKVSTTVMCLK